MRYALAHPIRTVRWWRYRVAYALADHRAALAALRSEWRARRRARSEPSHAAAEPEPERGEVIGRAIIGRDGELRELPREEVSRDWFARRSPLALEDPEDRHAWR